MVEAHWPAVADIYAQGIATGHATFETAPPSWEEFDATHLRDHRLVAEDPEGVVLGWAAASASSNRCVYAGVVEVSVYVHAAASGQGIGRLLLEELVRSTETDGIWTMQAGIFPENHASLALHRRAGFRVLGVRERLGLMTHGPCAGQWRDVVLLERRSTNTGI
jgi:L-amino acid N-acyltransferase YncA